MFKIDVSDVWIWTPVWLLLALYAARTPLGGPVIKEGSSRLIRVAHGISGAVITIFVLFHLTNHLSGLLDADIHEAAADIGRTVYRAFCIEPILYWRCVSR